MMKGEGDRLAEVKLACQRLSTLEMAESLGDVNEAFRQRRMTRTQFHDYVRKEA